MTIGSERLRALNYAREFLESLLDPKATPRIRSEIRKKAARVLRHYPLSFEVEKLPRLAPVLFGEWDYIEKEVTPDYRQLALDFQARYEESLQEAQMFEAMLSQATYALSLIANPKRNDGTYNRSREACEQLANFTLTRLVTMRRERM